jgi:hypothetical protein
VSLPPSMTPVHGLDLLFVKAAVLNIELFQSPGATNDSTCLPWKDRESKPGSDYLCRGISIATSYFFDLCRRLRGPPTRGKNSDIENGLSNCNAARLPRYEEACHPPPTYEEAYHPPPNWEDLPPKHQLVLWRMQMLSPIKYPGLDIILPRNREGLKRVYKNPRYRRRSQYCHECKTIRIFDSRIRRPSPCVCAHKNNCLGDPEQTYSFSSLGHTSLSTFTPKIDYTFNVYPGFIWIQNFRFLCLDIIRNCNSGVWMESMLLHAARG